MSDTERYAEIDEVIAYIHRHLHEPLPLERLARYVAYSPYHFARIFKEKIGLPPMYYISALRLQRAKDLLLNTRLIVRDVGLEIGQQSLGTFTTRFAQRVGVTPAEFRNQAQQADDHLSSLRRLNDWAAPPETIDPYAAVAGTIRPTVPFEGFVLVGLFPRPIPEGFPLYGTLVPGAGSFCFTDVQPGVYFLMATSVSWEMNAVDVLLPHQTLRTRSHRPIVVNRRAIVPPQEAALYPPRTDDPPILISLPLLMRRFLSRGAPSAY